MQKVSLQPEVPRVSNIWIAIILAINSSYGLHFFLVSSTRNVLGKHKNWELMANFTYFFTSFLLHSTSVYTFVMFHRGKKKKEKRKKNKFVIKKIENNEKLVRLGRKIYQVVALESMQDRCRLQSNSRSVKEIIYDNIDSLMRICQKKGRRCN